MRTVAGPLVLGLVAFASYSLKTNYAPPSNASPAQEATEKASAAKKPRPKRILNSHANKELKQPCVSLGDSSLQCAIDMFFGKPEPGPVLFNLGENKASVRFVIASVPDPIHTDLALSFDRFVEAISQGAQEAGYIFDHAVLPWPTPRELSQGAKGDDDKDSKSASSRVSKLEKENTPGLLIFRKTNAILNTQAKHLLVFLVGETPTAGIHKEQFQRALEIVRTNSVENPERVDIIGPTFSGSLYSLGVLEEQANAKRSLTFRIRSGTVMSSPAIEEFSKNSLNRDFLSFKDTDGYLIDRFLAFVQKDGLEGYKEEDVALISEDETALGSLSRGESAMNEVADHPDLLRVYFPRGISQLRTAYQDDPVLSSGADKAATPHSKLTLDLDSTGSEDDSVPAYAGRQTAISQEAVMMGIVTVLRTHPHRFLILRATDPKDLLFLTRFFRTNFPQDRIITMGADQLFPRDINDTVFRGVLSLTNYPLLPRQLTDFNPPRPHRVFASTESAGFFNATLAILTEAENGSDAGRLPQARYFEYTPPVFDNATTEGEKTRIERGAATKERGPHVGERKDSSTTGRMEVSPPAAWLTVMGDDGYWPLAILPQPDSVPSKLSTLHPHLCKIFFDLGLHPCGVFIPGPSSSLRPITIIPAPNGSDLSLSTGMSPIPISLQPSAFNELVIAVLVLFSAAFIYLTWFGNFKSRSTLQQQFSMLTDRTRGVLLGATSLLLTLAFVLLGSPLAEKNLWSPLVVIVAAFAVAISTVLNLRARNQPGAALFVAFSSALLVSPLFWITRSHHSINENLVLYRMAWLSSGVSPTIPLLLVSAGFFSWTWFNLKLRSLFDLRRPVLPRGIPFLPDADEYDSNEFAHLLTRSWLFWSIVALVIVVIIIQDADPLSLDGTNFDDLYRALFMAGVVFIANSMFIAWCTWKKCRALLLQLDRTPLRWAFRRIEGFSWKPLWGMAGGDLMGAYKPLSRSLEAFAHLRACLNSDQLKDQLAYMQSRAGLVDRDLKHLRSAFASPTKPARAGHLRQVHDDLTYRIHALQKNLALACSLVWFAVLEEGWRNDARLVTSDRQMWIHAPAKQKGASDTHGSIGSDTPDGSRAEYETQSTRLAEEFISLTYLNFIHRVLLRLRWLMLAATSAYVLLLFSAKLYPFEPHGHIDGLLILLFLVIASVVYIIYTQMHRDATLSHLTKTTPGELGSDFWIQMVGIGAVPILSLVATQVPALNRFFFLWLKPVIDAVHRS